MSAGKLSAKLLIGALLAIFAGIALYLRIILPYDQVFSDEWIKFTGIDAYYHMRLVDNIVFNFPNLTSFDPYFLYPNDAGAGGIHFFNWLLAGIIWVIGLGSPTQHTIDVIGAYFPAVLAALTVIPVYFIGKALFNRWVGVLSAALISVMSGEFLGRSILGFTDQHIAEVLFTTTTILFLILALKSARQRQLTLSDLKRRDWAKATKPIIYSLLAGFFLAIYLLTWMGALLFTFIIAGYLVIQFIIDHLRRKSTDYLTIAGTISLFIAVVIFVPSSPGTLYTLPMIAALLIPPVLAGISRLMTTKGLKPVYYPLSLLGILAVGMGVLYLGNTPLFNSMISQLGILNPVGDSSTTTMEMQPIFFPTGAFSTSVTWGNFTTGLYLSIISLGLLIWHAARGDNAERNLLLVWSVVILLATLGQRRFAYYFAVNVAVLTGYFSWLFLRFTFLLGDWFSNQIQSGFWQRVGKMIEVTETKATEEAKEKKKRTYGFSPIKYAFIAIAVIIIFINVFVLNMASAVNNASVARFAPSDAWQSSLVWMKENTPDPFGNPDFYYHVDEPPPQRQYMSLKPGASIADRLEWVRTKKESYDYPESFYGVLSWWDYGYWITRIAQRVPNVNPGQPSILITLVANAFLSQDEDSAREIIRGLDSAYLVIDHMTTTTKLWAIAEWADQEYTDFADNYYLPQEGTLMPIRLFYPEYYYTLGARLYNFDGEAVIPEVTIVVGYEENTNGKGQSYKQIIDIETFSSYNEALSYMASQESPNYRIVGSSPFISPVPLEAIKDYKLVHSSATGIPVREVGLVPEVKIFEYIGDK